jgi:hypothetical protein
MSESIGKVIECSFAINISSHYDEQQIKCISCHYDEQRISSLDHAVFPSDLSMVFLLSRNVVWITFKILIFFGNRL